MDFGVVTIIVRIFKKARIEADGPSYFADVPHEILGVIFRELDVKSLLRARLVTTLWNALTRDPALWKAHFQRDFGREESNQWESLYAANYRGFRAIKAPLDKAFWAIYRGYLPPLKALVAQGLDLTGTSDPLDIAAARGYAEIAEFLITQVKCPVNGHQGGWGTPLYKAAQEGRAQVINVLVAHGADIEARYCGYTPLYVASKMGRLDAVRALLKLGANVDANEGDGSTPLYVASQHGHWEIVSELLAHRANPELLFQQGYSPLYIACQNGYPEVVRLLCVAGAMPNRISGNGASALYVAAQNGHAECASILLDRRADVETTYGNGGWTPLYVASRKGYLSVVKVLVKKGKAKVNTRTVRGASPLYVAADKGHLDIVRYLLNHGADCEVAVANGYTPLHIAVEHNQLLVVEELLNHGASPRARDRNGETPLDLAVKLARSPSMIALLGRDH